MIPVAKPYDNLDERGWRYEEVILPNGRIELQTAPLSFEDYLNPQEYDYVPEDTFHNLVTSALTDMLRRYCTTHHPHLTVFSDLVFKNWGDSTLPNACPDVSVVPHVKEPNKRRRSFDVTSENARPILAIEVVSPHYRKADKERKPQLYTQMQIAEYLIFDQVEKNNDAVDEVIGYRLIRGEYEKITPDVDGLIPCYTVGLAFGLQNSQPIVIEISTGQKLLTSQAETEARQQAEWRVAELEARVIALEKEMKRLQGDSER